MSDYCALPKISGRLKLPCQAFAFAEIVLSAPNTMVLLSLSRLGALV